MAVPFFFEENLPLSNDFILSEETSKHVSQVLRMKEGEEIRVTNGKGQMIIAEIILPDKKKTKVKTIRKLFSESPKSKISIAISLIKSTNRFEWFAEKATEIGVSAIIPMICKR